MPPPAHPVGCMVTRVEDLRKLEIAEGSLPAMNPIDAMASA